MSKRMARGIVVLGLLPFTAGWAPAQDRLPPEAQKAEAIVKAQLDNIKGGHAQLIFEREPVLKRLFPTQAFIVARYRVFPVANAIPEGLRASNLFVVSRESGKTRLPQDARELANIFQAFAAPVRNAADARNALVAWLTLVQEFKQDGFYKFEVLTKEFSTETKDEQLVVSGRAMVTQGGKGELGATLVFADGKLRKATESGKIMPGPRPICQATRLLDRDPIVRKMAEQDLLFMGLAARDYLWEQRAKASPELRAAIERIWQKIQANDW